MRRVPGLESLSEICHAGKSLDQKPLWYTIHRRLSIRVTWVLLHTSISANHVSVVMIALGVASGALIACSTTATSWMAILALYGSFILDKVDGEIARFRGSESWRGVYLDYLYHRLVPLAFFVGLAVRLCRQAPDERVLAASFVAVAAVPLYRDLSKASVVLRATKTVTGSELSGPRAEAPASGLRGTLASGLRQVLEPLGAAVLFAVALGVDPWTSVDCVSLATAAVGGLAILLTVRQSWVFLARWSRT